MYANVPTITTNIGNIGEIVTDQVNGILIKPNDQSALIAAIRKIENDNSFKERIVLKLTKRQKILNRKNNRAIARRIKNLK